jgi:hypothetical protein
LLLAGILVVTEAVMVFCLPTVAAAPYFRLRFLFAGRPSATTAFTVLMRPVVAATAAVRLFFFWFLFAYHFGKAASIHDPPAIFEIVTNQAPVFGRLG